MSCPDGIYIHISIYKQYATNAVWCCILVPQMCLYSYCFDSYNTHCIHLCNNLDQHSNTISSTIGRFALIRMSDTHSWAWEYNTHGWVFLNHWEVVNIAFRAGRYFWNRNIWYGGVQVKYNTVKAKINPWKVLWRLFSSLGTDRTEVLWISGMMHWLPFIHSMSQFSPRHSTEEVLWNGSLLRISRFWSALNVQSMSIFWSRVTTGVLTSFLLPSAICPHNSNECCEFQNLQMLLWVRLIKYICILHWHGCPWKLIPDVIWGRYRAQPELCADI
jgi:hypothetical protein